MKARIFSIIFLVLLFAQAQAQFNSIRIRLAGTTYSARLVGMSGLTLGDTLTGTYNSTIYAHRFRPPVTGMYKLQYDVLGGSSFVTDTAWTDTYGVAVLGSDIDAISRSALSEYLYPGYGNLAVWDSTGLNLDSVTVCVSNEDATGKNYLQVSADTTTTGEQRVFLSFEFRALRNVSAITDTLFRIEFKTSSANVDSSSIRVHVFEGTTSRYASGDTSYTADWQTVAVLKSQGTLSSIVQGDRFTLKIQFNLTYGAVADPTVKISEIHQRWY